MIRVKQIKCLLLAFCAISILNGQCKNSFNARVDKFVSEMVFTDIINGTSNSLLNEEMNKQIISLTSDYQLAYDYKEAEKIEKGKFKTLKKSFEASKESLLQGSLGIDYVGSAIYEEKILTDGSDDKIYRYRVHALIEKKTNSTFEIWEMEITEYDGKFHLLRLRDLPFLIIKDKTTVTKINKTISKLSEILAYVNISGSLDAAIMDKSRPIDSANSTWHYSKVQLGGDHSTKIEGLLSVRQLNAVLESNLSLNPKSAEELLAIYNLVFSIKGNKNVTIETSSIAALNSKKEVNVSYQPKDDFFFQQKQGQVTKNLTYCLLVDGKDFEIKATIGLKINQDRTFDLMWSIGAM